MRHKQPNGRFPPQGMVTKADLALSLVELRRQVGLRQVDVAGRTGWSPSIVSRLESATGPLPDLATLARYCKGCGVEIGLIFAGRAASSLSVYSALTLQSEHQERLFEQLHGQVIAPESEATQDQQSC